MRYFTTLLAISGLFLHSGCLALLNNEEPGDQPLSVAALTLVALGEQDASVGTPAGGGTAGPAGATITSSDGQFTLHIPEGALQEGDATQEFTITRHTAATSAMPGRYLPTASVYQVTPSYRFQKNVTVEITLDVATIQANNLNQSGTSGFSWSLTAADDNAGRMSGWAAHESAVEGDKVIFSTRTFSLFGAGSPPPGNQPPNVLGAYYYFKPNCDYLPYRVRARVDEPEGDSMDVYLITGPAGGGTALIPMTPDGGDWYRADIPYEAMASGGIQIQVTAVDEYGANTTVPTMGTFLFPDDSGNTTFVNNYDPDSDGDGYLDAWEVDNGYDPNDPGDPTGVPDSDGDGIPDNEDHTPNGETNPAIDSLTIFPGIVSANVGEEITFAVEASSGGQPRYVNADFVTTGNGRDGSPVGTINSGNFTAEHPGTAGVVASVDAYNDTASVTVWDTVGPNSITDLSAFAPSHSRIRLQWTAPGNDGAAGKPAGYQIRRSSSPITNTTECFNASAVAHSLSPQNSGQLEILDVNGLAPNTTYYFCVLAFDTDGNFNEWTQGAVSATTQTAPDLTPPADVNGATATSQSFDTIRLNWTAVGDDGTTGSASSYEIRRSTSPINNDSDCDNAGNVANALTPTAAGSPLQFDVTGLSDNTVYYFCIRAYDDVSNRSSWSGFLTATTPDGNGAPVADAGPDMAALVGSIVNLDASASSDPDGASCGANPGNYAYAWTLAQKPATSTRTTADIQNANSLQPSFTPDVAGNYTLQFTFTDDAGACAGGNATTLDDMVITAAHLAPIKTGQTQCWDALGSPLPCAGTGQDGEYQAGRDADFTGPTQHPTYTSDYTTTDNATGLVWKSCSEGLSGASCGSGATTAMDWSTATAACDALNSANSGSGYAGRTDWQLPDIQQLETIIDYSGNSPSIYAPTFPATTAGDGWSASAYGPFTDTGWFVNFIHGTVKEGFRDYDRFARCVSPGLSHAGPVFTDNGDSTVTDRATGLVWQQCAKGRAGAGCATGTADEVNWTDALNYCNSLGLAGRSWRLPNVNELKSILDRTTFNPAIDTAVFPSAEGDYWSASTYVPNTANAWTVGFDVGYVDAQSKYTAEPFVRCVSD